MKTNTTTRTDPGCHVIHLGRSFDPEAEEALRDLAVACAGESTLPIAVSIRRAASAKIDKSGRTGMGDVIIHIG